VSRVLYEQDVKRRILALREDLVRHDENAAAMHLMEHCVPFFLAGDMEIRVVREQQREMCLHLTDAEAYARYYATNVHERPFEEQYPGATVDNAHEVFHRVAFLRAGLLKQRFVGENPRVLDVSCNDGWMAANLALAGYRCDGIDLNPDCIARAKVRAASLERMGEFEVRDFTDYAVEPSSLHEAVACFETIEHVANPVLAMVALQQLVALEGRLYVSTPNGVDHNGDLPGWDHVEPKGHVRVYTPETFAALLQRFGTIERMEQGPDRVMVAEVSL
jgi:2-polyprenyl-3-methyl-5-hydroxy-6-metoxy-1,4-benzoquinol methylase